ncbi:hypothetical protein Halhy_5506 [Haliscomenobacter hydrossis DSM 1100]|uniref:Uncharacterized protein n=1 Tax=Haliscomenobacter hydrossis (strain ATCC 27775 / DSM 1100 / LMG 10767 / O) TaxID=760192 RepID=F4KSC8_HALH1|nr:hypothetical protein Halhy_5506 [Haliscomenobacter hydrossis DSM 1100]
MAKRYSGNELAITDLDNAMDLVEAYQKEKTDFPIL